MATGDLVFGPGVTVLFGPSGAGKTTLLRCAAGLERPDAGAIRFGEETWSDADAGRFVPPRERRIGYVPQSYALFPHLTVAENIAYGRFPGAAPQGASLDDTLAQLGLDGLGGRLPAELSGGQRQRVALGRALWPSPRLLLLDEPLSALDAPTRERLRGELRALLVARRIPTVLVTHDPREAAVLGDDLVVIDGGRVLQHGPAAEVFNRPATPEAARITGSDTLFEGEVEAFSDGLSRVVAGEARLLAAAALPPGTRKVYVSIQAGDVSLALPAPGELQASSPRNRLAGTVSGVSGEGSLVRVEIDCGLPGGVPLKALLTREAVGELGLRPRLPVVAVIKAPRVHLMARD
ncbi:MAG TPA: ATP-binding cassette domain-containing protein [Candidatus Methylacidiphilales bacterium]